MYGSKEELADQESARFYNLGEDDRPEQDEWPSDEQMEQEASYDC